MLESQVGLLRKYIEESKLNANHTNMYPLFYNYQQKKLTRAGIAHILMEYVSMARSENPHLIPKRTMI
jgi:site-specific recombinase XerD